MGKTIYVTPIIELIALIFNKKALAGKKYCPRSVIEAYFIYVKNKLAPPEPGVVVSILKLGKNQDSAIRNRVYIKRVSKDTTSLETNEDIDSIWISKISPVLTDSLINELTSPNALKLLLGPNVEVDKIQEIQHFVKQHTQQLNPFIIMLVLVIERIAGSNNNRNGRRTTIDGYVQGIFKKLGPSISNIVIDETYRELITWNESGGRWILPKRYVTPSLENKIALWNSLAEGLIKQPPEFYDIAFSEEVLKCILGEENQDAINKVIQFAADNRPSFPNKKTNL